MSLDPDFLAELRRHFRGDIRLDLASRILYSTDASIYQIEPLGVVLPKTQEDLVAAVELAAKYKVPILPRGSGSSLAGQAIGEALILDCSRWLDNIVEINAEARTATIEPGVILTTLNRAAAHFGLQFGPDPASAERATMGGVIANNATGAHSIRYGMTADHLLLAEVILSDGSLSTFGEERVVGQEERREKMRNGDISLFSRFYFTALEIREQYAEAIKTHYPRSWRNSAGYRLNYLLPWSQTKPPQWPEEGYPTLRPDTVNLATLLAGSEGTLAVIRQATVNLVQKPKYTILGILAYESIAAACDAVPDLLQHRPSAIELVPQMILRLARSVPAYAAQMGWAKGDPAALLVVEFSGDRPEVLREAVRNLGADIIVAESIEAQAQVWNVRKVGLGILDSRPQSARPIAFVEDCAIPVEQLGEFVREVERILKQYNTEGGIYAHASAGCLHLRPILDLKTADGVRSLRAIAEQVMTLTLRLGGAMASEHGDGIARAEWLSKTYGEEIVAAMRALKQAADPIGLLNPRKMLAAPPMDNHLRYGPSYQSHAWPPKLDFARNGGLPVAIEQCNGQGVCRKDTGMMCPSYQATREEMHSTRGRANLLRALITSGDIGWGWGSAKPELQSAVFKALDLCLACKGCKAECPSGVDMAKLKSEFQAQYYQTHGRLLRDYLFGYFHVAARLLSSIAPLVNFATGLSPVRQLAAKTLKIAPNRPFPNFAQRLAHPKALSGGQRVLFLPDPYTHYVEPRVEQATFDLLFAAGYDVQVLPILGAGASLISKGFLSAARRHALALLHALQRADPNNTASLVAIEPSELYTLKNEYVDLLPDFEAEMSARAEHAWLLEEFLLRSEWVAKLHVAAKNRKIMLHPHCHQKAEKPAADGLPSGTGASMELLSHCGYDVELIEAGCCGMAGTFGYEAEHYELSQQIGSLQLFPKIQKRGGALIAATGAACRMQVRQGTDAAVEHPVVLAARTLQQPKAIKKN